MKNHNPVTGDELPTKSTLLYAFLLLGLVLTMVGVVGWRSRRRSSSSSIWNN